MARQRRTAGKGDRNLSEKATLTLRVNGATREATVAPDTPLLHVLREELDLKAARFGCGQGTCGACMVIVDGKAVPSCDTPVGTVEGKEIQTAEGLAEGPHPLIEAMIEHQAAQCGYCLPGIVMSAKALLDETPRPSRDEIKAALDGNLCRCGTHLRILRAVEAAAERMEG